MPPPPDHPPEPSELHRAFELNGALEWSQSPLSAADIANLHGKKATWKSLHLLRRAVGIEPRVTAEFLAALPSTALPYQLEKRVKSPESLARKMRDWQRFNRRFPIDDVLRYTVLTQTPDDLVGATRHTVDELGGYGWRVTYAMHSYTEGSRYKGIHAYLAPPGAVRTEIQFHSIASAEVKELTTPWYEIERSATATQEERAAARVQCVTLSATLRSPRGIDGLNTLGGSRVSVSNFSDSREPAQRQDGRPTNTRRASHSTAIDRNDGIAR